MTVQNAGSTGLHWKLLRRLGFNQRDRRSQLQINHQLHSTVQLVEQSQLLGVSTLRKFGMYCILSCATD